MDDESGDDRDELTSEWGGESRHWTSPLTLSELPFRLWSCKLALKVIEDGTTRKLGYGSYSDSVKTMAISEVKFFLVCPIIINQALI